MRSRDLAAVLALLPEVYAPTCAMSWPERVGNAVSRLCPGARVSYNVVDLAQGDTRSMVGRTVTPEASARQLSQLVNADPRVSRIRRELTGTPVLLTDHLSVREIEQSELYNRYYRPAHYRYQMAFALERSETRLWFVGLLREDDFAERERATMAVLQPHLTHAMRHLVPRHQWSEPLFRDDADPDAASTALRALGLTPRQAQVLYWISQGKRDGEIAIILGMSVRTAHHHVEATLRKLNVENRQSAALHAFSVLGVPGALPTMPLQVSGVTTQARVAAFA